MSDNIPKGYSRLEASERHPAENAKLLGPADPTETLTVTITVRRRPDGPPLPESEHFLNTPLKQRRRMPPEEFAALYGAADEDLSKVVAFAQAQGLKVVETHAARRTVVVSGTVAQMNKAFGVSLSRYEHSVVRQRGERPRTEGYRGRDGFIHVPKDLAGIVEGVFGLDDRNITKRNAADPPNTVPLTTAQITQLYGFPTNSAAGQTIGIVSEGGYRSADMSATFGGSPPAITEVSIDGSTNDGSADGETTQDICIAGLAAPGAAIAVYFQPGSEQGWVDLFARVAHPGTGDPHCSVVSSSFYICDGDDADTLLNEGVSSGLLNAVSAAFQDAAIQGVTICIASGDTGSSSKVGGNPGAWGDPFPPDHKAHVQFPGSSPWVLAVGGTTIGNVSGASFDEYVWNDPAPGDPTNWGTTGGGVSDFFGLPSWQSGAGVPASINDAHIGRGVPDVAGNASLNSGYQGIIVGGGPYVGAGTSASSPLWAGLIAVINAALGANVGFVNPAIYALGSAVFRDIVPGAGPADNSNSGVAGYPAGPGWDACTGWGSPNGTALLAGLQQLYAKDCVIITDRSTFGKDEIDAMLQLANPAVIPAAFYVAVDGFRPGDLGITPADLSGVPSVFPSVGLAPPVTGMSVGDALGRPTALVAQDPTLPPAPQRFTWVYPVSFTSTAGFIPGGQTLTLTASISSVTGNAQIQLTDQANVYEVDGPVSWLSTDTRVFLAKQGESWFNAPALGSTPADASSFIQAVIANLNAGTTGGQTFDSLPVDENGSALALYQVDHNSVPVFNFALSRVRYRALVTDATNVRVFFRLCPALSVSVDYDSATTYRRGGPNPDGQPIALLGMQSNNILTLPFFAEPRTDTTTFAMTQQTDPANVQVVPHDVTGQEVEHYFGCWLDINQPGQLWFPLNPTGDGPYSGTLQSVLQLVRNQHQCLLTEIAFDPDPIAGNPSPANSDKLAQRNLALNLTDNPGDAASRRVPNTFEVKPTARRLAIGQQPDEILIDWGGIPEGSLAQIYIPEVAAGEILQLASRMYTGHPLTQVDSHTVQLQARGITYVPIPPGTSLNHAGLLTVDLPAGIRRGQLFRVVVRQVTNAQAALLGEPRRGEIAAQAAVEPVIRWRSVRGSVQVSIAVGTAEDLLAAEETSLSILRHIQKSIPAEDRWYLVFRRYVEQVAERVAGFGGDPAKVLPSPIGVWQQAPRHGERGRERRGFTGKVAALVYDRFGDFEGFLLDTEEGEQTFHSHERAIERLAREAWVQRIRTQVFVEADEPHELRRLASLLLVGAPAETHHY